MGEKFEKAKAIGAEICRCNDILKRFDKISGSAYGFTTGGLFESVVDVAVQYVIDRKEQLEKEFDEL